MAASASVAIAASGAATDASGEPKAAVTASAWAGNRSRYSAAAGRSPRRQPPVDLDRDQIAEQGRPHRIRNPLEVVLDPGPLPLPPFGRKPVAGPIQLLGLRRRKRAGTLRPSQAPAPIGAHHTPSYIRRSRITRAAARAAALRNPGSAPIAGRQVADPRVTESWPSAAMEAPDVIALKDVPAAGNYKDEPAAMRGPLPLGDKEDARGTPHNRLNLRQQPKFLESFAERRRVFRQRLQADASAIFFITQQLARACASSAEPSSKSATAIATRRARSGIAPARSGCTSSWTIQMTSTMPASPVRLTCPNTPKP